MGDTLSFGLAGLAREAAGIEGGYNQCSAAYGAGEWAGAGVGFGLGVGVSAKIINLYKSYKSVDKWSRLPKSIQDQMTLNAAKRGAGKDLRLDLKDPRFKGMEKFSYKVKSANGRDSVVHYVRDPKTGRLMDFKFKKHSTQ